MNRLTEYAYGDPRARRKGDRISLTIGFLWYSVSLLLLRFAAAQALMQSIGVLIVAQIATTLYYCLSNAKGFSDFARERVPQRTRIATTVGVALTVVASIIYKNQIEAAVIDGRLRRIASDPNPNSIRTAAKLVSVANANRLVLFRRAVDAIVAGRSTLSDPLEAVNAAVANEARSLGITEEPSVAYISQTGADQIHISGISAEVSNLRSFGVDPNAFWLFPPQLVAFFAPIGSRAASPTERGAAIISVSGAEHHISIHLDGSHCKNVVFRNCVLIYTGKPIKLENTGFYNSKFEFSANLTCQRLAQEILTNPSVYFSEL
jgi:hypothetical protein